MNRPATVLPTTPTSAHELGEVFNEVLSGVTALAEAQGFPKAWCVPAAAVVRNLLHHIGVPGSRLIAVDCIVFTHQWAEPVASARGVPAAQVPITHGTMGSDEIVGGLWGGHLVVYVPSAAGGGMPWLLDPTADQFAPTVRHCEVLRVSSRSHALRS